MLTRRTFLATAAAATAATFTRAARAYPLGLPLGLQLYSVRDYLPTAYDPTLATLHQLGYRDVEAAGFFNHTPDQVKASMRQAGLNLVSSHVAMRDLLPHFDDVLAFHRQLGVKYLICASPALQNPPPPGTKNPQPTLADWRWNIDHWNRMADRTAAVGITFGYHNHIHEFLPLPEGPTPYSEILRLTDPAKLTLELDCGWCHVAGAHPVQVLRDNPHRISMLHVKDFKPPVTLDSHTPTELGRGVIDYAPIFAQAARTQHITYIFVEQEGFDVPWQQSLQIDAAYLQNLKP